MVDCLSCGGLRECGLGGSEKRGGGRAGERGGNYVAARVVVEVAEARDGEGECAGEGLGVG